MKQQILSEISSKLSELGIPIENGNGSDITINTELLNAAWSTGNKKINYESVIFANEQDKTVYMFEKTMETGQGLSFGSGSETTFQSGTTLFRKVKSIQYGPDGKAVEYSFDLGTIPKAAKETAKKYGWKFKTVINKNKAMYLSQKNDKALENSVSGKPAPAAGPAKMSKKKTFALAAIIVLVLLVALVFSAVSVNIMPYLGLVLMISGLIVTFRTRKTPRKVVTWSILVALMMQVVSFFFFSGIMQKSFAFSWVFIGLIVGIIFGVLLKLQRSDRDVFYQQKLEFSFLYLSLLLINQLIALFFNSYIPIVIFLSGFALGLYLGLHIVILAKKRKILKTSALVLLLCFSLLIPLNSLTANAAEDETVFQKNSQGLASASLTNSSDFQFTLPNGSTVSTSNYPPVSANSPTSKVGISSYYPKPMMVLLYVHGVLAPETTNWELFYDLEKIGNQGTQVNLDAQGNFEAQGTVLVTIRTWPEGDQKGGESTIRETWDFVGKVDQAGCTLRITQPNGNFEEMYFEYPPGFFTDSTSPAAEQTPAEEQPTVSQANDGITNESTASEEGSDENWIAPQGVDEGTANAATAASGIIAGLAALFSALGASLGLTGAPIVNPLGSSSMAGNSPNQELANGSESPDPRPADPAPPQPKPSEPRPPVGSRREDGKIFTKNNGWQNEDFPQMQTNSLKQTINSLENDIKKYAENGDKLRAEIASDELKQSQRKLKNWSEDAGMIGKVKSLDNEALNQSSAQRWDEREAELATAENTAKTISFAADIALAVGSGGVSSVYTGAKSIGTLKTAVQTVKTLTSVKEAATAGANIYDGYARGKNMAGVITKEIVNKGISMGIGKAFDAGKESLGVVKYGVNKSSDSLKILVASAETSASNIAQDAAENAGLTGKITGTVDAADEHFKGVANKLKDITKGGDQ